MDESLKDQLLSLVPEDGSAIGNQALFSQLLNAHPDLTEADYEQIKTTLLAQGILVRGRGRGGSVRRAEPGTADDFALAPQVAPEPADGARQAQRRSGERQAPRAEDTAPQIIAYRHQDRRKNNPEVGMVTPATDPDEAKTIWRYDPHIDPALQFDSSRSAIEALIDDALASGDEAVMRAALEELKRQQCPYLNWAGKAERTSFEVDTVSLHVHERIDAMSILSAVRKNLEEAAKGKKTAAPQYQADLFAAPFENLPLRDAIDFYRHERGWANRLIAGDSLLVMNSLLQKESMAGRVQMIYIDPPYGIKYGSNFQPFVGKREVSDGKDQDLTQEPEMIKAFRDTWELGIHSYLTYLRDRLLLARELLAESGSVFVQISDENLHHVRELLDDIFGATNFVSLITFSKTTGTTGELLAGTADYVLFYAKVREKVKYRQIFNAKEVGGDGGSMYANVELQTGARRRMHAAEREKPELLPKASRTFRLSDITSPRVREGRTGFFEVNLKGQTFVPRKGEWKTHPDGIKRLALAQRLEITGNSPGFVRYLDDFAAFPITNVWGNIAGAADKFYVVQTAPKVIERCLLMTTDPGDLVLDPTCGSGTTAFVAEKWGRRWITCDTSRVAVTLAKQRLLTASYDYFELRYPHEGLKGGFIYKTVPHVTLKSIANNPEIDEIYERMHPAVEGALSDLNDLLRDAAPSLPRYTVPTGGRQGQKLYFTAGDRLLEWEVPFDLPDEWLGEAVPRRDRAAPGDPEREPTPVEVAFERFHAARQTLQREMDRSIAAHADQETLYDQPAAAKNKRRITGPFTVEAVPFPSVMALEAANPPAEANEGVARSGESARQHGWRDELLKAGIRGKGGQMLKFAELEALPDTHYLHVSGHMDSGERVVVSFGPEHAALEQRQVAHALNEAETLRPAPKFIIFAAFEFDPEAAKDIDEIKWPGVTLLKAKMNSDLLTEDLKKGRASNQSFWLMGQPDVEVRKLTDGTYQVEVHGFDYFDTAKGELVSGGKAKIALWALDTDYDERSLFPRQVFFPMAGKGEGWEKLKKDIRAELNEELLSQFHGTVSLPFEAGDNRKIAVKIVDDRGIESLKVIPLV